MLRSSLATLLLVLAVGVGACGDSRPRSPAGASPAPAPTAGPLSPLELSRTLGDAFRRSLARLAVISQPGDRAADLGQRLPTGTVRAIACRGDRRTCTVRWRTAEGRPRRVRYRTRTSGRGCFVAVAEPRRPSRYDSTTRAYTADPLDVLASARRGC